MTKTIVHIGLPRTGTTTLQKHFFPKFCNDNNILFNPPENTKIKNQRLTYSDADLTALKKVFSKNDVLISQESFVDWNPRNWSAASDRVLELFGKDTTIVITIREPVEYMTSLFVHKLHEGNIINPEEFFVSSDEYDALMPFLPERSLLRFDHQRLDYKYLISLYKKKFKNVYIVPLSRINTLYPFFSLFVLNPENVKSYKEALKKATRENRSYSKLAVNLTFKREAILRAMNLKSRGSEDYPTSNSFVKGISTPQFKRFVELPFRKKLLALPLRVLKKIVKPWRWWMQRVLDQLYPYKKFRLPKNVLEMFDNRLMSRNCDIVRNAEKEIDALISQASKY
ncbi:hypothetical protein OA009_02115 [Paracoccaceae bacterium]|nr:hypothetical protein [Paracoccaceae bacterium]